MGRIRERQFLLNDLAAVTTLYESLPTDDIYFLERTGLESRIEELRERIEKLGSHERRTAEAVLYFYGDPVAEDVGIEAKFSSDVLHAYQDLVSKQVASQNGPVSRTGPIRAEKETRLHITNVVHGSFGFELEEVPPAQPEMFGVSAVAQAVDDVTSLLRAARESDEAFADVVASTDERVYDALRAFVSVVYKARAAFRLQTEGGELRFDTDSVAIANERASAERSEIADMPSEGVFQGVLLTSRRFEHQDLSTGEIFRGKVDDSLDVHEIVQWSDKPCVAHLRVVTLTRGTKQQRGYTLVNITPTETVSPAE